MQLVIADVLSAEDIEVVRAALQQAHFTDGVATSGFAARMVKDNLQTQASDRSLDTARKLLSERILGNDLFQLAVRPRSLSVILFSSYQHGMQYGSHIDEPFIDGMRTDVSFTLFLSDPESYCGGELTIETAAGEEMFKSDAGTLVTYPATSLHRVSPVTEGTRLAAVGWARSLVRDASRRELLFDLDTARRTLFAREGKSKEFDLISKSFANLLRMWAED